MVQQKKFLTRLWYVYTQHKNTIEIYEKVNKRLLKARVDCINHLIALRDNKPKMSAQATVLMSGQWQRVAQFTGSPLNNKFTFTLPSDTNFKKRDDIALENTI